MNEKALRVRYQKNKVKKERWKMYDVIIIGAGVSGAAAARELSRFEYSFIHYISHCFPSFCTKIISAKPHYLLDIFFSLYYNIQLYNMSRKEERL